MAVEPQGVLNPVGGGDPIPLLRNTLLIGRRESCDICLRFANISGRHCEMTFRDGYWIVRDLNSTNGIKVNGDRVMEKALRPGDELMIGKRPYVIEYKLELAGEQALQDMLEDDEAIMSQGLMEKAGLSKPRSGDTRPDDEE